MTYVNGLETQQVTASAPPAPGAALPGQTARVAATVTTDRPATVAAVTGSPAGERSPARRAPWVGAEPPVVRVLATALGVMAVVAFIEILLADSVGWLLGLTLIVASLGVALIVRPNDLFTAGVFPPLLLVSVLLVVAVLHGDGIQVGRLVADAGVAQRVIAGFVHLAGALVAAHALTLIVVALRGRISRRPKQPGSSPAH